MSFGGKQYGPHVGQLCEGKHCETTDWVLSALILVADCKVKKRITLFTYILVWLF